MLAKAIATVEGEKMSEYPDILYEVSDRIATITLNRPDRLNAYNGVMADSIKCANGRSSHRSERPRNRDYRSRARVLCR